MIDPKMYFHVSILVPNLEEGIANYSKFFNITFRAPTATPLSTFEQFGVHESATEVRFAYSVDGPPYYELVEAAGSGHYALSQGAGFHHVGMWMDDAEATRAELAKTNIKIEGIFWAPDGHPYTIHTGPVGPGGIRVEYVNRRYEEMFLRFYRTGQY